MISLLVNRCSELGLNFITALVLPDLTLPTLVNDIKEILVDGLSVAIIDDFVDADDNTLCMMSFKYGPEKFTDYHSMVSQLLNDPPRSEIFYVDGDRFAILAIRFTNYLLKHVAYVFNWYWPTVNG